MNLTTPQSGLEFGRLLAQGLLDLQDKNRANFFPWRGQFSPQLIENLLKAYCPPNATLVDPFVGSGTVLYEATRQNLTGYGFEINPAAWLLSRTYELINLPKAERKDLLSSLKEKLNQFFPEPFFFAPDRSAQITLPELKSFLAHIYPLIDKWERTILETLVILLDVTPQNLTAKRIHSTFNKLSQIIVNLPVITASIRTALADARRLPVADGTVDFVITSPPYINVFNYHQNYRQSAEILGWDLLKIAKSEIGSNRANRANRFCTVIQYCLDMSLVLRELRRVCQPDAKIIIVVGYESNVLGVPFFNAEIISHLATKSTAFALTLRQKRSFQNRFGKTIREDLLHFVCRENVPTNETMESVAREVAFQVLSEGLNRALDSNKDKLEEAVARVPFLPATPFFSNDNLSVKTRL